LGVLRADGPSTATALAARLGESSGTTSYHLRQLAAADFVVEDTERGNGRERWWRASQQSTRLEVTELDDEPATLQAVDVYLGTVARHHGSRIEQWVREGRSWPDRWWAAGGMSDFQLSLTAAELERLNDEVEQLVEGYRRAPRKGDERVVFQMQGFPVRELP
ncbi:MAG: Transcriptional regulator, ArsR family, partial [Frankiales bacterium]|nr:Transcriptional regulator, ArsR family [Frankiales bacterium]